MWEHIGKNMFGISLGLIGILVLVAFVSYITFMVESSIGAGILFLSSFAYLFFFNGMDLTSVLLFSGAYLVSGIAWATFRLIRNVRRDYENRLKSNNNFDNEDETNKEILSTVLDKISFSVFGYRIFFMPIDMINYLAYDFVKGIFEVIKRRVRKYLFKSILGEVE